MNVTGEPVQVQASQNTTVVRGGVSVSVPAFSFSGNASLPTIDVSVRSLDVLGLPEPAGATVVLSPAVTVSIRPALTPPSSPIMVRFPVNDGVPRRRRSLLQSPSSWTILIRDPSTGAWKRLAVQDVQGLAILGYVQPQDFVDGGMDVVACPFEVQDVNSFPVAREPGEVPATTTPAPAPEPPKQSSGFMSDPVFVGILILGVLMLLWASRGNEQRSPPPPPSTYSNQPQPPRPPATVPGAPSAPLMLSQARPVVSSTRAAQSSAAVMDLFKVKVVPKRVHRV